VLGDPAVRLVAGDAPSAERPTISAVSVPTPARPPATPVAPAPAPRARPAPSTIPAAPPASLTFAPPPADTPPLRRQRLLVQLQGRRLEEAYLRPDLRRDLEAEAASPDSDRLIGPEQLALLRELVEARQGALRPVSSVPTAELFFSTDQVVIVPGFLGSELSDLAAGGYGLIWLSPGIAFADRLGALRLAPYDGTEADAVAGVRVEATGALPLVYDLLRADLELRRYTTEIHPVDWRKDLDLAAQRLVNRLRALVRAGRPIHLIAHSQGALVARRALQLLNEAADREALDQVRHLVLLGPANFGTFSAAFAIAGTHSLIEPLRRFAVEPAAGFRPTLASMSGTYQLLPWDADRVPWLKANLLLGLVLGGLAALGGTTALALHLASKKDRTAAASRGSHADELARAAATLDEPSIRPDDTEGPRATPRRGAPVEDPPTPPDSGPRPDDLRPLPPARDTRPVSTTPPEKAWLPREEQENGCAPWPSAWWPARRPRAGGPTAARS
jgi:hypothetical protein